MLTFREYITEGLLAGPGKSAPKTDPKKLKKYMDSLQTVYTSSTKQILDKAKDGLGLRAPGSNVLDRHGKVHSIFNATTGTASKSRESVYFAKREQYTKRYGIAKAKIPYEVDRPGYLEAERQAHPFYKGDAGVPATATVKIPKKLLRPDEYHPDWSRPFGGGGRLPDDTYKGIGPIGAVRTKRRGVSARRITNVQAYKPEDYE